MVRIMIFLSLLIYDVHGMSPQASFKSQDIRIRRCLIQDYLRDFGEMLSEQSAVRSASMTPCHTALLG